MIRILSSWGNPVIKSEYGIHKKIMKQSKNSNYDWLASADELVNVCNKRGFNRIYAIDIKCAILNCYADLYHHRDVISSEGVFIAFNDLLAEYNKCKDKKDSGIESDKIFKTCSSFLNSYIFRITFWKYITNTSESFYKADREYRKNKIAKLMNLDFVDFDVLPQQVREEYKDYIEKQISNGTITYESVKLPEWDDKELNNIKHYSGSVLKRTDSEIENQKSEQQQPIIDVDEINKSVEKAVSESGNEEPHLVSSYLDENGTIQNTAKKLVKKPRSDIK